MAGRYDELKAKAEKISALASRLSGDTRVLREQLVEFYQIMRWENTGCTQGEYEELSPLVGITEDYTADVLLERTEALLCAITKEAFCAAIDVLPTDKSGGFCYQQRTPRCQKRRLGLTPPPSKVDAPTL